MGGTRVTAQEVGQSFVQFLRFGQWAVDTSACGGWVGAFIFLKLRCVPFSFTSELGGWPRRTAAWQSKARGLASEVSNQGGPAQLENVVGFGAAARPRQCGKL